MLAKYIVRYPLEALVLLVVLYFNFVILFESFNPYQKFFDLLVSIFLLFLVIAFGFAFREKIDIIKQKMFYIFLSGKFQQTSIFFKLYHLVALSLVPLFLASSLELFLFTLLANESIISFGFPFSIYSFSASKILFLGLFWNFILYACLTYVLGSLFLKESHKVNNN